MPQIGSALTEMNDEENNDCHFACFHVASVVWMQQFH